MSLPTKRLSFPRFLLTFYSSEYYWIGLYLRMDDTDIRYIILKKLRKENAGTAEFSANQFLASLHRDLGTIRRALTDLIKDGYIWESNIDWDNDRDESEVSRISTINSVGPPAQKDSKRLLTEIKPIRIYITLKGMRFLIESYNLRRTTWNLRNEWWIRILFLVIGAVIAFASAMLMYILTAS